MAPVADRLQGAAEGVLLRPDFHGERLPGPSVKTELSGRRPQEVGNTVPMGRHHRHPAPVLDCVPIHPAAQAGVVQHPAQSFAGFQIVGDQVPGDQLTVELA